MQRFRTGGFPGYPAHRLAPYLPAAKRLLPFAAMLAALSWPALALSAPLAQASEPAPTLWPLILAMLVLALGVERVMELLWNYVEWLLLNTRRLNAADLKGSIYLKFKSATSVLLGAILGVLLASLFSLHLFAALQPLALGFLGGVPVNWDVALTGVVVGVLAKPVHDFVGLLAELKNLAGSAAVRQREEAGAAMAEGVLKLAQSDAQGMIEVPGMGPTRLTGGEFGAEEEEGAGASEQSPTERYIEILHNRTTL